MTKVLTPPDWSKLFAQMSHANHQRALEVLASGKPIDSKGRYLHWDEMRHRNPPNGLTLDEWWMGTAYSRSATARPLPLTSVKKEPFHFSNIVGIFTFVICNLLYQLSIKPQPNGWGFSEPPPATQLYGSVSV